ncbi:MAG: YkgJ family cysteine cluster protein [Phycisphaerae bacterium]|nr:YkgJ family cysteine cluster protein [Phycisphaerae bacterium]
MEKNPEIVARLARERADENWGFRAFLKAYSILPERRVDNLAERFARQAEAQVNCTTCAACCRDNYIPVNKEEIARLARRLNLTPGEFASRYVQPKTREHDAGIDARPCPFLQDNLCSVYEDRPEVCQGYPYIGSNVASRTIGIIERAGTCPIIFDMLERLKDKLGYNYYRRGRRRR